MSIYTITMRAAVNNRRCIRQTDECHLSVSPPSTGKAAVYGLMFRIDETPAARYSSRRCWCSGTSVYNVPAGDWRSSAKNSVTVNCWSAIAPGSGVGSPGVDLYAPLAGAVGGRHRRPHPVGKCPETVTSCGVKNEVRDCKKPRIVIAGFGAARLMVLMGDVERP